MESKYRSDVDKTVEYYERNASVFIDSTIDLDVSELYRPFEKRLSPGCKILDLGCGSGRDSKYFVEHGFHVVAIDPSPAMCIQTRSLVHIPVFEMKAEDMQFSDEFDGVWACASLLHVSRDKQMDTLCIIGKALKSSGICYCSWKYGSGEHNTGGRHFTDFTEKSFRELLKKVALFEELEVWITCDVRRDRQEQKWLNALLKKGS